jgi:hypothetical protein
MRGVVCLILAVALDGTASWAGTSAALHVALVPEHLGRGTTIEFGFDLDGSGGSVPQAVTTVSLLYPSNFGILTSGLGHATCTHAVLEERGSSGCPSRSLMGFGTAVGATQIEGERVDEDALTSVYLAPFQNGEIALLFFLDAYTPLETERVFDGVLHPVSSTFDALTIKVPLIESFPESPDVALVRLRSTIGPLGIIYYAHIHGQYVPYRPGGIVLPLRCPKRGFPFAARFTFTDGREMTVSKRVPCPQMRSGQHARSSLAGV